MALPTAAETKAFDTYIETYLGEPFIIGPAKDRQVGGAVTGGITEDVIEVTNLNNSGAGSFRQAIADAKTAGGGWIRVTVSGTVTLLSDIAIDDPVNITVDARGQDFKLSGQGIYWNDTSGGTSNNGNIVWINVQQVGGANNNDYMQNYNRDHDFAGGFLLAYSEFQGFNENLNDEAVDFHINVPDNVGKDITTAFLRFEKLEDDTNGLAVITWADAGSPANNPSKFKMLEHHTYYAPTAGGRAIDYRTPLHGGRNTANDSQLATAAVHYLSNCFIAAQENGAYCSGSSWMHGIGNTLDGQYAGGDKSILFRPDTSVTSTNASVRVDDVRLLNSASYAEQNRAVLTTASSLWASFTYCAPSADHDDIVKKRAGASLRVTLSGTAVGTTGAELSGKYFDLTWPTGTLPTSTTFDNMRQAVIDGWDSVNGSITGADMFSGVAQITRQSATTIRCTVDQNLSLISDDEVFWWGPFSSVSDTRHYGTPFPATVLLGGAAGGTTTPTPTLVTADDSNGSSATTHDTASFTPDADTVYVVDIVSRGSTVSSVAGGGITYTKLREIEVNPNPFTTADINISRWYGMTDTPSNDTVTITQAGNVMASWIVTKLVDALATGTNGVDAFGSGDTSSVSGSSAGITMTPAAFTSADSAVLVTAAIIRTDGNTSHDLSGAGDGLTELAQNGQPNAERTEHATYWKAGEDTSITVSWTESGPILASVGIADEIIGVTTTVTLGLGGDMPAATGTLSQLTTYFRTLTGNMPASTASLSGFAARFQALAGSMPAATATLATITTRARTLTGTMGSMVGSLVTVYTHTVPAVVAEVLRFVWHDGDPSLPHIKMFLTSEKSAETRRPPRRRRRLR